MRVTDPDAGRHQLLRTYLAQAGARREVGEPRAAPGKEAPRPRVLLFENLFTDPDRPASERSRDMSCATFQLSSSLRRAGCRPVVVRGRLDPEEPLDDVSGLERALDDGVDLVAVTVLEACFTRIRALVDHIGSRSAARVVVGGPMCTLTPVHVAAHLPGATAVVRGAGERVLPELARLLCGGLTAEAQERILELDGVLVVEDGTLLAGHLGRVNEVDPDSTPMDFDLLGPEHLEGGLSLETSRGCTNPCLFCTTPGRRSHVGRSPEAIAGHLAAYDRRLRELYGERVPRVARRIQICDDDFTCDPDRARAVLETFRTAPFELAAFQASVRDLVVRERGSTRPNDELLDAIRPELFMDAPLYRELAAGAPRGRPPRRAGTFVHLGVEAFDDPDLRRLGKGYRAQDACRVVGELDRRSVAHDAYLILAGPGTTLDDLATSLTTIHRLKIQHPHTFFVRIPVVPFVVPVFPSASYELWRARSEQGRLEGAIEVERTLRVPGFPEWDYPLVSRAVCEDPDARAACEQWERIIEPDPEYARPLRNLADWLVERLDTVTDPERRSRMRRVVRTLRGARKRVVYEGVGRARRNELPATVARRYYDAAARLGPAEQVAREAKNAMGVGDPRLVVIPTRDCSLRCTYCPMDKREGLHMDEDTFDRAVELLLSASARDVILQFFGGEALLRRGFVMGGMRRALERGREAGKRVGFILSTNGVALDEELLEELSGLPVKIEISIDGPAAVHDRHRRPRGGQRGSYEMASRWARRLARSSIPHEVIMVVTPQTAPRLCESFAHVASLGFRSIQVNHALAVRWSTQDKETFARELMAIAERFYAEGPGDVELLDLRTFSVPMLLNCEVTVDHDGTVYYGNGFLVRTADPDSFRAGHLDDLECMDTYLVQKPDNDYLIRHTYPEDVAANNLSVARVYASFVRHMRRRFPELARPSAVRSPASGHPR